MRVEVVRRMLMLATVAIRMVLSVGTLVIVASAVEPLTFGIFATTFAVGSLVGLLSNAGFPLAILQDVGAFPEQSRAYVRPSVIVKALGGSILLVIGFAYLFLIHEASRENVATIVLILGSLFVGSFGDLLFTALRATGHYLQEFLIMSVQATFQIALFLFCIDAGSLFCFAIILATARICGAFFSMTAFLALTPPAANSTVPALVYLKRSAILAIDGLIVNLSVQFDGIIVASSLGFEAAGIYQAAARVVQGAIPFGAILASISIPKISAALPTEVGREVRLSIIEFTLFGVAFGMATLFLGPLYVHYLLDPAYNEANTLWPLLAWFVIVRFACSGLGAVLSVLHKGILRTLVLAVATFIPFGLIALLSPGSPIILVVYANLLGAGLLFAGHGVLTLLESSRLEKDND